MHRLSRRNLHHALKVLLRNPIPYINTKKLNYSGNYSPTIKSICRNITSYFDKCTMLILNLNDSIKNCRNPTDVKLVGRINNVLSLKNKK